MDGAEASSLYPTVKRILKEKLLTSRRNAVMASKVSDASPPGAVTDADLGGSSKYSSETLEGQCGEGFHVNSS